MQTPQSTGAIIRRYFSAYETKDRIAIEEVHR